MKIVLTGGGTAGHVFPGVNIGNYMRETYGAKLYFVGNKHHIEEKIAKQQNIPFYGISSQGLEGKTILHKYVGFGAKNVKGVFEAVSILRKINPDYVLGTGGFVSAPTLAAARILGIPFAIHEQNTVMGKVNKLFVNQAKTCFYSFPVQETRNVVYSGNPVRFKEKLTKNGEHLVFLGGSGGSIQLNQTAIEFAKKHPEIPCIIVTGERNYQRAIVNGVPDNVEVHGYVEDMQSLYEKAKLFVARSGAGSVFELANLGIPSILVPLPTSADDHQKKNAEYFSLKHAAVMVEQNNQFEKQLGKAILDYWNDDQKRSEMKDELEKLARRNSDQIVAERIVKDLNKQQLYLQ